MLRLDHAGAALLVMLVALGCGPDPASADGAGTTMSSPDDATSSSSGGDSSTADSSSTGANAPFVDEPYGSGSRLTARVLRAAGGAQMLRWFWDQELQLECVFARAPDGVVRCLPRDGAVATQSHGNLFGLDPKNQPPRTMGPDCRVPAAVRSACEVDSPYVYVSHPMCEPGPVVREALRLHTSLVELGSRTEDGVCEVREVGEGSLAFTLMPVDHTIFMPAEEVVGDGVRTLLGDDGSWQNLELAVDSGQGCFPLTSEGDGPCVPSPAGFPVTASSDDACALLDVAGEPTRPEGCSYVPTHAVPVHGPEGIRDIVGPLETAYQRVGEDETCEPNSIPSYQLGAETELESLPVIALVESGSGGIVARHGSFDGISKTVVRGLFDTGTGDACVPWFDGERHWCIPYRVRDVWRRYADPDCTQDALAAPVPLPFVGEREVVDCIDSWTFFEPEVLGGPVYRSSLGECIVDESAGEYRYTFGDPLQTESVLLELFLEDAPPPA